MLTQYHIEIMSAALADRFSSRALSAMITANLNQDNLRGQFGHDEYHVDNSAFDQSHAYMEEQRTLTVSSLMARDIRSAWSAFGRLTHTAQDFYAHSNYITLWLSRFDDGTRPAPPDVDPIDPTLIQSPELHSGRVYYPLELLYFVRPLRPYVLPRIPRDSHAWMNLDSPEQGFKFDYAVQAAIKRTRIEFEKTTCGLAQDLLLLFIDNTSELATN